MLVTFRSEASANITMFGDAAVTLLKLMGCSGELPGALLAADVPGALARLRAAVDSLPAAPPGARAGHDTGDEDRPVSLRQRALPVIQLLEASARRGADVVWEVNRPAGG